MDEKKTETKVVAGGIVGIVTMMLPVAIVGMQAIIDAGLVASGTWAYVALVTGIAVTGKMIQALAQNYADNRTALKIARLGTVDPKGDDPGSIRTKISTKPVQE